MAAFRVLGRHENGRSRPLYEAVFPEDGPRFTDYYYESRGSSNRIYVMEEDSVIVSMLHLNPVLTSCYGTLRTIPYIVAVATDPAYRHQGMMRTLLGRALNDCADNRVPFAFLMPASEAIYTPFGFRNAWPWRWEADCAGGSGASGNTPEEGSGTEYEKRAGECTDKELSLLSGRVNRKLSEQFEIFALRTPEYYRDLARGHEASGGRLTIRFAGGQPVCAISSETEEFPPMMARITDLVTFIRMIRPARGRDMLLKVTDEIIPANNGVFRISLRREGSVCERLDEAEELRKRERLDTNEEAPETERPQREKGAGEAVSCDISAIPALLGEDNPFASAMISEEV